MLTAVVMKIAYFFCIFYRRRTAHRRHLLTFVNLTNFFFLFAIINVIVIATDGCFYNCDSEPKNCTPILITIIIFNAFNSCLLFENGIMCMYIKNESLQGDFEEDNKTSQNDT
ncbi:hypothetical protein ACKWTF_004569 [Chironomus riparius]